MAAKRPNSPQKRTGKESKKSPTKTRSIPLATATSVGSEKNLFDLAVVCALCSLLLYCNTLQNDFVYDDTSAVVRNPDARGESSVGNILINDFWGTRLTNKLSHKSYRPITTFTYRITALMHGVEPLPFHLASVFLNAVTCYMAVKCVGIMDAAPSGETTSGWLLSFPVLTCLLFTFHPIHTEVVATVVGQADILCAIFSFAAFSCHYQSMMSNSKHPLQKCLLLAWLSALSKETGLTILGICGAHEVARFWLPGAKKELQASTTRFAVLAGTGVLFLAFRKIINGPNTGISISPADNPLTTAQNSLQYFLTAVFIMALYMWRLINPFTLLCDYGYNVVPLVEGLGDMRNLASLALFAGTGFLAFAAIRDARGLNKSRTPDGRLLMALAWIFVPLLPASHIMTIGTVLAERLLFMPSLGYCMLVSLFVERVILKPTKNGENSKKVSLLNYVLVVILALFTSRIVTRNQEWQNSRQLWQADYKSHPQNVKIAMSYATDQADDGNLDLEWRIVRNLEGLGDTQRFELCKIKAKAMAFSQEAGQDYEGAYRLLDQCIAEAEARKTPSKVDHFLYSQYGFLLSQQKRVEEAVVWFRKGAESAARVDSDTFGPLCNEGEGLAMLGKWADSVPVLEKCIKMAARAREPKHRHDIKVSNLAKAYYMTRQFEKAEEMLLKLPETTENTQFLNHVQRNIAEKKPEQQPE